MKKPGLYISNMKAQFKYEYADVITECFKKLDLFITIDGKFVDMISRKYVRDNQVKCMLRHGYINSCHGQLTGRLLTSILDRYLIGIKNAAAELANSGETEHTGYYDIEDSYL